MVLGHVLVPRHFREHGPRSIYYQETSLLFYAFVSNYLCNQCLSPQMLWVRISIRARCTTLCDKVCQWLATGRWFSPCPPVSSTNKTDCYDITEILLKVALNTTNKQTNKPFFMWKLLLLIAIYADFFGIIKLKLWDLEDIVFLKHLTQIDDMVSG